MAECVILYRAGDGSVEIVRDLDGKIAVFPYLDAAIACCDDSKLSGQVDHQIVELDEL